MLTAMAEQARGTVLLADGDPRSALGTSPVGGDGVATTADAVPRRARGDAAGPLVRSAG